MKFIKPTFVTTHEIENRAEGERRSKFYNVMLDPNFVCTPESGGQLAVVICELSKTHYHGARPEDRFVVAEISVLRLRMLQNGKCGIWPEPHNWFSNEMNGQTLWSHWLTLEQAKALQPITFEFIMSPGIRPDLLEQMREIVEQTDDEELIAQ